MRQGNRRDLGGLSTASGSIVRRGVLLRSEAPATLDEVDRRRLDEVALVFDLRAAGEADDAVTVWRAAGGPEIVRVPLLGHQRLYAADVLIGMCTDADPASRYMIPDLLHCAGGQDRTGVAVAVVLLALGVPGKL